MKYLLLIPFYYLFCSSFVEAQQNAQFSQYMFNQLYFNPATAGADETASEISLLHRSQWLSYDPSFDDGVAPTTQLASINIPFQFKENRLGVGVFFLNDNLGLQTNMDIKLSLAYHIKMKVGLLSFGFAAGFYNQRIDFERLRFREPNDPLNLGGTQNNNVVDYDFGIYFNSTSFFMGVGISHLLEPATNFSLVTDQSKLRRHFNFIAGLNIDVTRDIKFTPSILVKSDLNSYSFEVSGIANYNDRIYAGVSLREIESAVILLGIYPIKKGKTSKRLRIGYSFDYIIQQQRAKTATSHEITLSYRIPVLSTGTTQIKPRTPRFRH